MSTRPTLLTAAEAASRVPAGAGLAIPGNAFRLAPESLLAAIESRFLATGAPSGLSIWYPMMIEAVRGTRGIPGTGLNRLAHPGLLARIVGGSFSRVPAHELNALIRNEGVDAYNLPMGTLVALYRAAARREAGLLVTTGLETAYDPRRGGGRLNARTTADLAEVVDFRGSEYLWYPAPKIDVALIRASLADERGNVSFENDAFTIAALHAAAAAKNNGGQVFVEVDAIVEGGTLDPRKVVIPGHLVTGIVRAERSAMPADAGDAVSKPTVPEWAFAGTRRAPLPPIRREIDTRAVIARRALRVAADGDVINLGAGLPMYDVPEMARADGALPGQFRFSIEQGPFGGWPEAGGVAANPDAILDIPYVFDYYMGGGIDVSILSFAEVDAQGSVNVSRFGPMMPGCGGFVDITQNTRSLVFCGMLMAGADVAIEGGRVNVKSRGKLCKFVPQLTHLTFNANARVNRAEKITYVTERAVFVKDAGGLVLTEIAPGVDVRTQVLDLIPFPVRVAPDLVTMDAALFAPARGPGA